MDDIKVKKTRGHKPEIKLDDSVIVKMKYPSLDTFVEMNFSEDQGVEQVFKMGCELHVKVFLMQNKYMMLRILRKKS